MKDQTERTKAHFVYIIDSPTCRDALHGQSVGQVIKHSLGVSGMACHYEPIVCADNLYKSLSGKVLRKFRKHSKQKSILHINGCGSPDGLILSSHELISWEELRQYLAPINRAVGNKLIVCLSGIDWCYATELPENSDACCPPYHRLIANFFKVGQIHDAIGFPIFYYLISRGSSLEDAVHQMRNATVEGWYCRRLAVQKQPLQFEANAA